MKYFGTDGIRGRVNVDLNERLIKKVASGIVRFFDGKNLSRKIVVGNDTRRSGDYILAVLCAVLLKNGVDVVDVGVCTSPALAYITKNCNFSLGVMLSASHNTSEYNGIKFFNRFGEKVDDAFECEFVRLMDKRTKLNNNRFANYKNCEQLLNKYYAFLKGFVIDNISPIFDCAFGGAGKILKNVLPKCKKIHYLYDGTNINCNAGCTHPERLIFECVHQQKIGFAFDGDADRILVVDNFGRVYDGDEILFLLSKFYLRAGDCLVGTIYSNSGLDVAIKRQGINFVRALVGDKMVYKKMNECACFIGGEKSGHIIIKPYTRTGDGILTALFILKILNVTNKTLSELVEGYTSFYQINDQIDLKNNFVIKSKVQNAIDCYTKQGARIVIRPSGTEPILRIMVEHQNKEMAENILKNVKNLLENG